MAVELVISIKDGEGKKLSKPFLIYDSLTMDTHDPVIDRCLTEVIKEFNGDPEDVKIRATLVVK